MKAFEKGKEKYQQVRDNSRAIKDTVLFSEDKQMVEELMLDNKTMKQTVAQLLLEKQELEEQIETLKDLEADASEQSEELALKILLIESEKKISEHEDGDDEVRKNLMDAKELLELKGQLKDKSIPEYFSELRTSAMQLTQENKQLKKEVLTA